MTTKEPEERGATDFDSIHRVYEQHRRTAAVANALNKTAVFDGLVTAGVTAVFIDFDGEGDSGQIGSIVASAGEKTVTLPGMVVPVYPHWDGDKALPVDQLLSDALEELCYGYLEQEHGGWENDSGAYGEFRFDVSTRTIKLEFNARYTDVFTETHSL